MEESLDQPADPITTMRFRKHGTTPGELPMQQKRMPCFRCVNLEHYQHYQSGHRKPIWLKFYFTAFGDYHFSTLPDASKIHLVGIWTIAMQNGNCVPYDPVFIGRQLHASEPVNLDLLLDSGFIELIEDEKVQPNGKLKLLRQC